MKNKNGITLIALIISIIVLVILAGVSISLVIGDNGVVNKASKAKTETALVDVKETAEIIRGEYELNNDGNEPTPRYIIERLISNERINSSQVEDYGDETGIGIVIIEGKRLNISGNIVQTRENIISAVKKYYLTNLGNMYYIENYTTTDNNGLVVNEENLGVSLYANNVKEIFAYGLDNGIIYVTNDNNLYYNKELIAENIIQITKIESNVNNPVIDYIDSNNNLYSCSIMWLRRSTLIDENVVKATFNHYLKENGEIYSYYLSSGETSEVTINLVDASDEEVVREDFENYNPIYDINETNTSKYRTLNTSFIDASGFYSLEYFDRDNEWQYILIRTGAGVQ